MLLVYASKVLLNYGFQPFVFVSVSALWLCCWGHCCSNCLGPCFNFVACYCVLCLCVPELLHFSCQLFCSWFLLIHVIVSHALLHSILFTPAPFLFLLCFYCFQMLKSQGSEKKIVGWWRVKLWKIVVSIKLVVCQLCHLAWVKDLKVTFYETYASLS